ncbi:MAG: excinuclease ABC subunit UvrC, partial [Planctomycetota bacterium]|nr:excinuclease ABC subunit UvrC [Planctomycetota bacterium]
PTREQYRRFRIKTVAGVDDFASVKEIVTRRYDRLLRENAALPDVILIDGGLGQLHAAQEALAALPSAAGASESPITGKEHPCLASLAKKEEIVYTLARPEGLRLPRRSPALRMLQYVRDEAHRFARHYHHILRRKRVLDE